MQNDELLKALAALAREEHTARNPKWTALVEGRLSPDEHAMLVEEARQSEEAREAYAALQPLDVAAKERIAQRLLSMSAAPQPAATIADPAPRSGVDEVTIVGAAPPATRTTKVNAQSSIGLSWGRYRKHVVSFGAACAALAVLVWGLGRDPQGGQLPPGVAWTMDVRAEQGTRGEPSAEDTKQLGPGSRLELRLRATQKVEGPLEARGFLARDGRAWLWNVPVTLDAEGAARIAGTKEELFAGVHAGRYEIIIAMGRPRALPSPEMITAQSQEDTQRTNRGYLLYREHILLRDSDLP